MSTTRMPQMRVVMVAMFGALAVALAPIAHADPDTDFANELHSYSIYGPKDYNAWIGKIMCKRLSTGLDANAAESAVFLNLNLPKGTTTQQTYQFMASAISYYCEDQRPVLLNAAGV